MRESLNPVNGHLWSKNGSAWHVPPVSTNMSHRPQWTTQLLASLCFKWKWYQAFKICELWKRPQKTLMGLRKIECNCCLVSECVHLWKRFHLWPLSSARELLSSWFKGYLHFPTSCGKERFSILTSCGKRDFPTSLALGGKDFPTSPAVGWKIFQPH